MCQMLNKSEPQEFEKLLSFVYDSIRKQIDEYSANPNINNYMLIQNYLIFFMVIALNLRKKIDFIKIIFNGKLQFFQKFIIWYA